ncbi:hypothetical protein BDZ91DRAFT_787137 [Kalaharituber pfeilii]|nr:hypothetical protein BDZ91DRAFT_787137 [Kalaharituber pfeilii]
MIFGLFFFPTPMALRSCLFHQLLRKFVIASIPTVPLFVFNLLVISTPWTVPLHYSTCPKYFLNNFSTIALTHAGGSLYPGQFLGKYLEYEYYVHEGRDVEGEEVVEKKEEEEEEEEEEEGEEGGGGGGK